MDTSKLRKFASFARSALIEQVGTRLKTVLAEKSLARRESPKVVEELEKKIKDLGEKRVIEMVAYTWFNRFCALRYMDVNRYTRIGILSPADGQFQPEILAEAKMGHIDEELVPEATRKQVMRLLDGSDKSADPQGDAYRLLLVAVCNYYHSLMPFMFERIADYTELLLPDDLLSGTSLPAYTREALLPINSLPHYIQDFKESVEVIGWLYQFYVADKKDEVFDGLKKGSKIAPENIPAATQLFTPHWIVRYLVENSLGRLWMLNHPDSKLVERMDYYIKPKEPETDFQKISSPEEIKICDPACGSGHMLTYAFDLLYEIYREEQYPEPEIPSLILKNNLYGIEIDPRAGALAAFALTMKARERDKRFFTRKPPADSSSSGFVPVEYQKSRIQNPNICVLENIKIDPDDLSNYMDKVGRDLFTGGLQGVVNQWEESDNFGSLIRPLITDVSEVLALLRERQVGQDLFLATVHQQVLKALRQADYLSPKYHVVVANPPYMGARGMNPRLKESVSDNFENSKSDLGVVFIERSGELAHPRCYVAMVTMHSWMFLTSYEGFREAMLDQFSVVTMAHLGERAFDTIGGAVVATTAFVLREGYDATRSGVYIDLTRGNSEAEKQNDLINLEDNRFYVTASEYKGIPGAPLAYWVSPNVRKAFSNYRPLGECADIRTGMQTGDNAQFVRYWHEVSFANITLPSNLENPARWYLYSKGGEYRAWSGNVEHVVDWKDDGDAIKNLYVNGSLRSRVRELENYFRPAASWSFVGGTTFGCRYKEPGVFFDVAGSCALQKSAPIERVLGFMCSKAASVFLNSMNPTLNYQIQDVANLPFADREDCTEGVSKLIQLSEEDWASSEGSWNFESLPLLRDKLSSDNVSVTWSRLRSRWMEVVREAKRLEVENNELFINEYELDGELASSVDDEDVVLFCNPNARYGSDKSASELDALFRADTMREFVSYAVGCMFGRYSLDKPGLILANQGETVADYYKQIGEPTFAPDQDNVIPALEGEWFFDDISQRFKDFLKVTFGIEQYDENLEFLENALYPDNPAAKKRKTIRDYFLKDFYDHHLKLYKKRPIYWLFSSPKGTFNALIYMHRYRPETVGKVLECLRDFREKLAHHSEQRQGTADSASESKAEKAKAVKDVAAIKKQLKELEEYEKSLFEVASRMRNVDIDLDNGVKHNYLLFGPVLRKIPGLDAKDD